MRTSAPLPAVPHDAHRTAPRTPCPPARAQPTLDDLQRHDPAAAAAVRRALDLPAPQLAALAELEGLPPSTGGDGYAAAATARLLVGDVAWQHAALAAGFRAAAPPPAALRACCLGGAALADAVCGAAGAPPPTGAAVRRALRVALDGVHGSGGGAAGSEAAVVECLWAVLDAWPPPLVAAFLRFATGCGRLPPPGAEPLTVAFPFPAAAAGGPGGARAALGALPRAHTCTNTLELPDYYAALARAEEEGEEGGGGARRAEAAEAGASAYQDAARAARCREVLAERLAYAVVHGGGAYALDE